MPYAEIHQDQVSDTYAELSLEARKRINAVVDAAMKVLENEPTMGDNIRNSFNELVKISIKDPGNIKIILETLQENHMTGLNKLHESKKLPAEKAFSDFITSFSTNIANANNNENWEQEILALRAEFARRKMDIRNTTHAGLQQLSATTA